MKFLKWLAAYLLVCLSSNNLFAQSGGSRTIEERVSKAMIFLQKHTSATEEQQQKANPIYTTYYRQIDSLRATDNPRKGLALQSIQEQRNQQLATFLSDTQMTQLKNAEKLMIQQRRQRRPDDQKPN